MNKHIVSLLALTLGFGVNVASAQLSPETPEITIVNTTYEAISSMRIKVRLADGQSYKNGSLRIDNLAAGAYATVNALEATKHVRSQTEQDKPRKDGETKGKVLNDQDYKIATRLGAITEVGVVKIKSEGANLKLRKKYACKAKDGNPAQEISRASEYMIVGQDEVYMIISFDNALFGWFGNIQPRWTAHYHS